MLERFSTTTSRPRALYRAFVGAGIGEGRRKDLTGGGLARSNRGWRPAADSGDRKGDERILGSTYFVREVMKATRETRERTHGFTIKEIDFAAIQDHVARLFALSPEEILLPGKYCTRVAARSVPCYFLVRKLGMTAKAVAERLAIGQPAFSIAVARGEAIAKERGLQLP